MQRGAFAVIRRLPNSGCGISFASRGGRSRSVLILRTLFAESDELVTEIDGGQQAVNQRDCTVMNGFAVKVIEILRFWNNDVMQNIEGVLLTIANSLRAESAPSPGPRQGEDRPPPASGAR